MHMLYIERGKVLINKTLTLFMNYDNKKGNPREFVTFSRLV